MCYDKSVPIIFHHLLFACLQIISDTSVITRMILMTKLSGDPPNIQSASGELIERRSYFLINTRQWQYIVYLIISLSFKL